LIFSLLPLLLQGSPLAELALSCVASEVFLPRQRIPHCSSIRPSSGQVSGTLGWPLLLSESLRARSPPGRVVVSWRVGRRFLCLDSPCAGPGLPIMISEDEEVTLLPYFSLPFYSNLPPVRSSSGHLSPCPFLCRYASKRLTWSDSCEDVAVDVDRSPYDTSQWVFQLVSPVTYHGGEFLMIDQFFMFPAGIHPSPFHIGAVSRLSVPFESWKR